MQCGNIMIMQLQSPILHQQLVTLTSDKIIVLQHKWVKTTGTRGDKLLGAASSMTQMMALIKVAASLRLCWH
jgi:hypothetical protein